MVDPLPHFGDVLDQGPVWGGLLVFPSLLGHIEQTARLSSEEELKRSKACGRLGDLPYTKEDVWQHLVPVSPVVRCHSSQHLLEGLVEAFDESVRLRVVYGRPQLLYLQQLAEVSH